MKILEGKERTETDGSRVEPGTATPDFSLPLEMTIKKNINMDTQLKSCGYPARRSREIPNPNNASSNTKPLRGNQQETIK